MNEDNGPKTILKYICNIMIYVIIPKEAEEKEEEEEEDEEDGREEEGSPFYQAKRRKA